MEDGWAANVQWESPAGLAADVPTPATGKEQSRVGGARCAPLGAASPLS
eukprot:gene3125-40062_t